MAVSAEFREKMIRNKEFAQREADMIKDAESIDLPFLSEHLRNFVLYKYQLDPQTSTNDNFYELTIESIEVTSKLPKEIAEEVRNAKSCDGATTTATKKALLLQSIQRTFDIRLDAFAAVKANTMTGISQVTWDAMEKSPVWAKKMK